MKECLKIMNREDAKRMRLIATLAMAALSVAACGGSGSPMTGNPEPVPMP